MFWYQISYQLLSQDTVQTFIKKHAITVSAVNYPVTNKISLGFTDEKLLSIFVLSYL